MIFRCYLRVHSAVVVDVKWTEDHLILFLLLFLSFFHFFSFSRTPTLHLDGKRRREEREESIAFQHILLLSRSLQSSQPLLLQYSYFAWWHKNDPTDEKSQRYLSIYSIHCLLFCIRILREWLFETYERTGAGAGASQVIRHEIYILPSPISTGAMS